MIESEDLWKTYDGVRWALAGVDLRVREGEVLALLGRNGAGKTTFIKIASSLLKPTKGTVRVLGMDVTREAARVRERIALVPQEGRPSNLNTPWSHVYYYLIARGLPRSEARLRARRYLQDLELWEVKDVICGNLSGGMRQRVLVAMALATEADVLFLDEPTIGLDPVSKQTVWEQIRASASEGRTVVVTTHNMEEAETISDRVAVINAGRIVAQGTPEEVRSVVGYAHRVDLRGDGINPEELSGYGLVRRIGDRYRVYLRDSAAGELLDLAIAKGWAASLSRTTLEDAFVLLVGEVEERAG
ncbi:MAG: ABC transporter ATP-binding protein [Candidatus Caldarchaeales archaeon]